MKRNHPFACIPEWVLDAEVSHRAKVLFGILDRYRRGADSVEVRQQEIADRMRCSLKSVERSIGELKAVGALVVEPNVDGRGQRESSYWLWPWGDDTRDGAGAPPETDPATTPVTDPSSLLERKRQARSQANGTPRKKLHPEGKQILDEFYESRNQSGLPLPVPKNWAEATRIIGKFLDAGHTGDRLLPALEIAPAITTNCISIALDKLAKRTSAGERPSTWGVELLTPGEWEEALR